MGLWCLTVCFLTVFLCIPLLVEAAVGKHSRGNQNRRHLSAEQQFSGNAAEREVLRPGSRTNESKGTKTSSWPYHFLPMFVQAPTPLVDVQLFRPVISETTIPSSLRALLVPSSDLWRGAMDPGRNPRGVEVWCGYSKLSVRVNKRMLGFRAISSLLYMGTCGVTRSSKNYHYFHYDLSECGTKRTTINGRLVYSNTLHYSPEPEEFVMRALPLSLPIQCLYNRFHYIYKVGYLPEVNKPTFFKRLERKSTFKLTAYNARWKKLMPNKGFLLGEPIYFEASTAFVPENKRVFINACYASPSEEPNSMPQMDVIKNFGCMVDSKRKRSRSKFISSRRNALRFVIDAFVFPNMSAKYLYLHCSITVGNHSASPSTKSCNFNRKTKRWEELHNSSSVCSCCDSVCAVQESRTSALPLTVNTMITNGPWVAISNEQGVVVEEKAVETDTVPVGDLHKEHLRAVELPLEVLQGEPLVWKEDGPRKRRR